MSWISTLANVYDDLNMKGKSLPGSVPGFVPIGIITLQAQLEITLSEDSELIRASLVEKNDSVTYSPVTEKSANRTSGIEAHPLFDYLDYIAGDFEDYSDSGSSNRFSLYISQLKGWHEYDPENVALRIVYEYLNKRTLIRDLIELDVLKTDPTDPGKLDETQKYMTFKANRLFVRMAIEISGKLIRLWEDEEIQNSFAEYYLANSPSREGLCYVTGQMKPLAEIHGKYIRFPGDGAKLISSNDSTNYTYRGRFETADQAIGISVEATQKAHSALRWLIRNQGTQLNEMVILAFGLNPIIPQPLEGSLSLFEKLNANPLIPTMTDTGMDLAREISKAIAGFRNTIDPNEKINLIILDNATPGRMGILYYQEFTARDYLDNLAYYQESMKWEHGYWDADSKEFRRYFGVPNSTELINCVFGVERQGKMEVGNKDKYFNQLLRRMMPMILSRGRIPMDFVNRSFQSAITPLSKTRSNWEKCMTIACGIIRKNYEERGKVDYSMALDPTIRDRSYLYGRLLAVAEKIERDAMGMGSAERTTNAMRVMTIMSNKPYTTWVRLETKLQPYLRGLSKQRREYWSREMGRIMDLFEFDDFILNKQLEGAFVLGYHCQLQDFYKKKNTGETQEEA